MWQVRSSRAVFAAMAVVAAGIIPAAIVNDNASAVEATVVLANDFEADLAPWTARGDETNPTLTRTDAAAHGGTWSAAVADRAMTWHGIGTDVTELFEAGATYHISAWVKLAEGADPDPSDLRLSIAGTSGEDTTYTTIATVTGVTAAEWVQIDGDYTHSAADTASLYVESVDGLAPFQLDDVLVTRDAVVVQTDITALKDAVPWPLGMAIDERETTGAGAQLVTMHASQITAENVMKPETIQATEGTFTFDEADKLVDFAVANGMRVYGHTLVWHSQTPDWFFNHTDGTPLTNSADDQEILRARMQTHITAIADHFRARYGEFGTSGNPIVSFDVVNEAISESEDDGLRRSRWYEVLGENFIDLAFGYASEAFNGGVTVDAPVKLFLNDYNTESPAKRTAMVSVVQRLLERGVPIDGIGHQFHVSLSQPISQMQTSIDAFAEFGLLQAVTELDVGAGTPVTSDALVQQGYYYADLFDMLREYPDLFSVTLWGPYDSRSWRSDSDPLVFDASMQAKPAYWGIVDRTQLPALTRTLNVHEGDVTIDAEASDAVEWDLLPLTAVAETDAGTTGFQVRWAPDHLTVYVSVVDATVDAGDAVALFTDGAQLTVGRDGTTSGSTGSGSDEGTTGAAVVTSTDTGYVVTASIPATDLATGDSVPFDVRITDGGTGDQVSWNDLSNGQEDGLRLGSLTMVEPVARVAITRATTVPVIDGVVDDTWADAPVVTTDVAVTGTDGATAEIRLLWSDGVVHVLAEVTDPVLNEASTNAWEQDSIEVFVNPGNTKAGAFGADDGQYRISYTNATSIGGETVLLDNLTSAAVVTDSGYRVEASIALAGGAGPGTLVGLDFQVNDADASGVRTATRMWTDPTGRSYQDTGRWGVGQLVEPEAVADPQITVSSGAARAGRTTGVELSGFVPGSSVQLRLERSGAARCANGCAIGLGNVVVDDTGAASVQVMLPCWLRPGAYTIAAVSGDLQVRSAVVVKAWHRVNHASRHPYAS